MTTDPTTPQPQTPEQVIAGVLAAHLYSQLMEDTCNEWPLYEYLPPEVKAGWIRRGGELAAEVVAALGLREDYRPHFKEAPTKQGTQTRAEAESWVNAVINRDEWEVVRRYVTDWRPTDAPV